MTSHCAGTVQMREESERAIRKWEEMWLKMTPEDGEGGQQWCAMEDCSIDEQLRQETLCRRQWTDEYVKHPESLMRQNVKGVLIPPYHIISYHIVVLKQQNHLKIGTDKPKLKVKMQSVSDDDVWKRLLEKPDVTSSGRAFQIFGPATGKPLMWYTTLYIHDADGKIVILTVLVRL